MVVLNAPWRSPFSLVVSLYSCKFGEGYALLRVNGIEAKIDGNFGNKATATIKIDQDGTAIIKNPNIQYKIEVQYDSQPSDLWWSVIDRTEGKMVKRSDIIRDANAIRINSLDLEMDHQYLVQLGDAGGDGIANGYVRIFALVDGVEKNLKLIPGHNIGGRLRTGFRVALEDLLPHTGNIGNDDNQCQDDATEFFHVSDAVGQQDCAWLQENIDKVGISICQFVRVARACRSTCNSCSVFTA